MELKGLYIKILLAIEVIILLKISFAKSSKSDKFKYRGSSGDFLLPQLEKPVERMSHDFHFEPHHIQELREIYSTKNRVKRDAILKDSIVRVERSPQFGLSSIPKPKAQISLNSQVPDSGRLRVDLPNAGKAISNSASLLNLNENLSGGVGANVDLDKVVPDIGGEVDINIGNLDADLKIGKLGKIGLPKIKFGSSDRDRKNDEETNSEDEIKLNLGSEGDDSRRLRVDLPNAKESISNSASLLNLNKNLNLNPNGEISLNLGNGERDSLSGGIGANEDLGLDLEKSAEKIQKDRGTKELLMSSLDELVPKINGEIDVNIDNKNADINIGKMGKVYLSAINTADVDKPKINSEVNTSLGGKGNLNLERNVEQTDLSPLKIEDIVLKNDKETKINGEIKLNIDSEGIDLGLNSENSKVDLKNDDEAKINEKVELNLGSKRTELNSEDLGRIEMIPLNIEAKVSKSLKDPILNSDINLNLNLSQGDDISLNSEKINQSESLSTSTIKSDSETLSNIELEIIREENNMNDEKISSSTVKILESSMTSATTEKIKKKEEIESIEQGTTKSPRNLENKTINESEKLKVVDGEVYLPPHYNPLKIPKPNYGKSFGKYIPGPLFTLMFINILGISDIDELKHQISFDADMTVEWIDGEIFDISSSLRNPIRNKTLVRLADNILSPVFLKKVWRPDLYMNDLVSVNTPTISNKAVISLKFNSLTGFISYKVRMTITVSCPMSFEYYPADTQNCEFRLASYSHPSSDMSLDWLELKIDKTENFTGVRIVDPTDDNFDLRLESVGKLSYTPKLNNAANSSYDVLTFTIAARRKISYHLIQTYLPSVFNIFITWLVFLIPYSLYDCRIGTTMTTLLTLTAMFSAVREGSPQVNYIKAIDLWMLACVSFVFLNLVELTLMTWLRIKIETFEENQKADREKLDEEKGLNVKNGKNEALDLGELDLDPWKIREFRKIYRFFSKYSFIGFAGIFLTFNLFYWTWLFIASEYFNWEHIAGTEI